MNNMQETNNQDAETISLLKQKELELSVALKAARSDRDKLKIQYDLLSDLYQDLIEKVVEK